MEELKKPSPKKPSAASITHLVTVGEKSSSQAGQKGSPSQQAATPPSPSRTHQPRGLTLASSSQMLSQGHLQIEIPPTPLHAQAPTEQRAADCSQAATTPQQTKTMSPEHLALIAAGQLPSSAPSTPVAKFQFSAHRVRVYEVSSAPPPPKRAGYFDRALMALKSCLRRPDKQSAATAVKLIAIVLQGMTFYFWISEENNTDQKARNTHLVFIALANGFLLRFNFSSFSGGRHVVEAIDRTIQSLALPVILAEQAIITSLFTGDWRLPAAQSLVLGLAGTFNGMRLDKIRHDFSTSTATPLEEIDYQKGLREILSIGQGIIHKLPHLFVASALITAGTLGSKVATTHNEKVFANTTIQFGTALATASVLTPILERSPHFRRFLSVKAAVLWSSLVINFFPPAIRPADHPGFGVVLGIILATNALASERLFRHQNVMFERQQEQMAKWNKLFPDFITNLENALNEPRSIFRKLLLLMEGQPIDLLSPRYRKAAAIASFPIAAGLAAVLWPAIETFFLMLTPAAYIGIRHAQLTPKAYAALCEKEFKNGLNRKEQLRLNLHKIFCGNPAYIGMAYVASINIWDTTGIDALSLAMFTTMTGIFYATENRRAYNSSETLAKMQTAFQLAYYRINTEQQHLLTSQQWQQVADQLGITPEMDSKTPAAAEISLSFQEAVCVREQSSLPTVKSTSSARFLTSPTVKITNERHSSQSQIHQAAITGAFSGDLSRTVLG